MFKSSFIQSIRKKFDKVNVTSFLCNFKAAHRDVLEDGFGDDLNGKADAVFLDLPKPWAGIPHAVAAIKDEGRVFMRYILRPVAADITHFNFDLIYSSYKDYSATPPHVRCRVISF